MSFFAIFMFVVIVFFLAWQFNIIEIKQGDKVIKPSDFFKDEETKSNINENKTETGIPDGSYRLS